MGAASGEAAFQRSSPNLPVYEDHYSLLNLMNQPVPNIAESVKSGRNRRLSGLTEDNVFRNPDISIMSIPVSAHYNQPSSSSVSVLPASNSTLDSERRATEWSAIQRHAEDPLNEIDLINLPSRQSLITGRCLCMHHIFHSPSHDVFMRCDSSLVRASVINYMALLACLHIQTY